MNCVLGDMLRTFCDLNPSRWDEALPIAEFAANNAKNSYRSTGQTAFFMNYEWHPATPLVRELEVSVLAAKRYAQSWKHRLTEAQRCLDAARQRAVEYYDRFHRNVTFSSGQPVLLSTKNLRSRATGPKKLLPRWIGPFEVDSMVEPLRYV